MALPNSRHSNETYPVQLNCKTLNIKSHNICFLDKVEKSCFIRVYFNKEKVTIGGKAGVSGAAGKGNDYSFEHEFTYVSESVKKIAITSSNGLSITFDPQSVEYKTLRAGLFKARIDAIATTDPDAVNTFDFRVIGGAKLYIEEIMKLYPAMDVAGASDESETAKKRRTSSTGVDSHADEKKSCLSTKTNTIDDEDQLPSSSSSLRNEIHCGGPIEAGHLGIFDMVFSCSSLHLGAYLYTAKNSVFIEKRIEGLADPKIHIYMKDHKDENTVELLIPYQKDGNFFFTSSKNKDEMVLFLSLTNTRTVSSKFGNLLKLPNLKNLYDPCSEDSGKKYIIMVFKMTDVDEGACLKQIVEKFGTNIRILSPVDPSAQLVSSIIMKNLSNQNQ